MPFVDTLENDQQYMASSEIMFFVRHLFAQVAALRPEDSIDFAAKFFKRIQTCHHVLGAEYAYIGATANNRRAFIFCLTEIFATFSPDESMSTAEYEQVVEMICPDFPRKMIHAAAACCELAPRAAAGAADGTGARAGAGGPVSATASAAISGLSLLHTAPVLGERAVAKHRLASLRVAVYFHVLYEEWLKYIETIFREEGSLDCLSMFRLRAYLEDCRKNWSISFSQPPAEGINAALASITATEISFSSLLKAMFKCAIIQDDVTSTPAHALPLLTEQPKKKSPGNKGGAAPAAVAATAAISAAALPAGVSGTAGPAPLGSVSASASASASGAGAASSQGSSSRAGAGDGAVSPRRTASIA